MSKTLKRFEGNNSVAKTNKIIALNGKYYDVVSGAHIPNPGLQPTPVAASPPTIRKNSARPLGANAAANMDGVMQPSGNQATFNAHNFAHASAHVRPKHPVAARTLGPIAAHKPQQTKTLMRHAVKPPVVETKPTGKAQTSMDVLRGAVPSAPLVAAKRSSTMVDPQRSRRADISPRSGMVRRFAPAQHRSQDITGQLLGAPTLAAPSRPAAAVRPAPQPAHRAPHPRPAVTAVRSRTDQTAAGSRPVPANADPAFKRQDDITDQMFTEALKHAVSHEQPAPAETVSSRLKHPRKAHRRLAGASAAVLAVALFGGFVAYQNRANIQLQIASSKAGFHASLPAYKPAGFAVGTMTNNAGTVAVRFQGPSNQAFDVTQKQSNWNSETLLENFVATTNQPYQAYQANGRTVYVYGQNNSNATWVNKGVWYQVQSDGAISTDDMLKVASTM